ncbi:MAG TPA: hypothetical protein VIK91_07620 [Nannocystis sp.]
MRGKIAAVNPRVALAWIASLAPLSCTPEPASTVELRQTVVEMVDQGRAMAIEDAMVALVGAVQVESDLGAVADAVASAVASAVPCATVTRPGAVAVRIAFGQPGTPCVHEGVAYSGTLRVVYTRPSPDTLRAKLFYEPLVGDRTRLDGEAELTWAEDGSQRLVSELRVDAVTQRQVEVQADRVLFRSQGELKVEGWRRWQTLMGRWEVDLAGLVFAPSASVPHAGLAAVETPFSHTIVLDYARQGETAQVRVSGGRRDRIFEITPEGEVIDAGDG